MYVLTGAQCIPRTVCCHLINVYVSHINIYFFNMLLLLLHIYIFTRICDAFLYCYNICTFIFQERSYICFGRIYYERTFSKSYVIIQYSISVKNVEIFCNCYSRYPVYDKRFNPGYIPFLIDIYIYIMCVYFARTQQFCNK